MGEHEKDGVATEATLMEYNRALLEKDTGGNCLCCNEFQASGLHTGPDGCLTLCDSCFKKYVNLSLEQLYCNGRKVSVKYTRGALYVRKYKLDRKTFRDGRMQTWQDVFQHPVVLKTESIIPESRSIEQAGRRGGPVAAPWNRTLRNAQISGNLKSCFSQTNMNKRLVPYQSRGEDRLSVEERNDSVRPFKRERRMRGVQTPGTTQEWPAVMMPAMGPVWHGMIQEDARGTVLHCVKAKLCGVTTSFRRFRLPSNSCLAHLVHFLQHTFHYQGQMKVYYGDDESDLVLLHDETGMTEMLDVVIQKSISPLRLFIECVQGHA